jgi:hypothetical protein
VFLGDEVNNYHRLNNYVCRPVSAMMFNRSEHKTGRLV